MRKQGFSWHITCWDYRGHGDSSKNFESSCNLWVYGVDLCLLTQHIRTIHEDSTKFWCIAHSIGGAIGAIAQILQPNLFSGCLFIEPVIVPPPYDINEQPECKFLSNQALKKRNKFSSLDEVKSSYLSKPGSPMAKWHHKVLEWYLSRAFKKEEDGSVILKCEKEAESNMYKAAAVSAVWDMLKYFNCNVAWIMYGEDDSFFKSEWVTEMSKRMNNAHLLPCKGKDHWMPMTHPKWMSTQVIRFCIEMSPINSNL